MTDIILDILAREGGYVNDPKDRGGATNFGITQRTLAWWRKDPFADPKTLGEEEAKEILQALYIDRPGFGSLALPLKALMVDWGVHSGPAVAIKALQEIVGVTPDGILGPLTHEGIAKVELPFLLKALTVARMKMIARIVAKAPSQAKFLPGWTERVLSFLP